ncbi:MAG: membrane protein insertase YidC [Eubacteriales bacterium]|nr:membrane protein insertase YidC [Eubacteriales bacterium]
MNSLLDIIAIPLETLLSLCYNLVGSYGWAIVIFTFLTKIILLPISVWVQKNSLKMVRLMPEINRLKSKYYGDNDSIAEETQKLYKREKYYPLVSSIPAILQILLLLGVISAVKKTIGNTGSFLTAVPAQAGRFTILVPIIAAIASFFLGIAQNRINPLQREQRKSQQWATNILSIAISFFLGFFVSIGVGIYWICSNLFSILQQLLLNFLVKPENYVNYEELIKSKEELNGIVGFSEKLTRENRKREKIDYKKFFSVANKHLVFYSEKSGFYKYYENIIEYLLKHSNVIIHYITNDPDDQIFSIAEEEPKIHPYYISENKLITLFMKMDADIVVMTTPDLDNMYLKRSYVRKDIEYIYTFHYPLSTHMVLRTGALDKYDTVFCVGDFQFDEIRSAEKLYGLPKKKLLSVGYGQLEQLYKSYNMLDTNDETTIPHILIAPSWQQDNILDSCIDRLLEELLDKGFRITVRPHPEYIKRYKSKIDSLVQKYINVNPNELFFELDFTSNQSIFASDVLITDWSGTAYEFSFVTLRPSVFIDTPPKINNPEYTKLGIEPLELALRDKIGIRTAPDTFAGLSDKIWTLIKEKNKYADTIESLRNRYIANFGESGTIAGQYIIKALIEKKNVAMGDAKK